MRICKTSKAYLNDTSPSICLRLRWKKKGAEREKESGKERDLDKKSFFNIFILSFILFTYAFILSHIRYEKDFLCWRAFANKVIVSGDVTTSWEKKSKIFKYIALYDRVIKRQKK